MFVLQATFAITHLRDWQLA